MQLKVIYEKHSSGDVRAVISVTDKGDYITDCIFNNPSDWPSLTTYDLKSSACSYIAKYNTTTEDAIAWVNEVVNELKTRLTKWREVKTPKAETYTL